MRIRFIPLQLLAAAVAATGTLGAQPSDLARRGSLGAVLRSAPPGRAGAEIERIAPASAAARAGLKPGDRLLRIGETRLVDGLTQHTALEALRAGRPVTIEILTAGGGLEQREAVPDEVPRERVNGLELEYGSTVTDSGHRVRTITSRPHQAAGRLPAVVVVGWLSCDSVEAPEGPQDGFAELIRRVMTGSGMVVLRVDKPGVGDSEGPPCAELDFEGELAAYRAAFRAARAHPWIDPQRIVLMGMSNGGGIAPLVAQGAPVAGYMVLGGWVKTWFEHMMFTLRVEERLRGRSPAEISDRMRGHAELYAHYLLMKQAPGDVIRERPHLAPLWTGSPRHQYGRPAAFFHQLQDLNLEREWSSVSAPTLAVHGGHDRLMARVDHALIVELVNRHAPGRGRLIEYPTMDHGFYLHESMEQSFKSYRSGRFNEAAAQAVLEWLGERR